MGNVVAFCETAGAALRTNAKINIALARRAAELCGGEVVLLLAGKGVKAAADDAAKYAPKVLVCDDDRLEHYLAETHAPVVARIARDQGASIVSATASAIGKDMMPRVAAELGVGMASDIAEMTGKNQFRRAVVAGNAFANVEISTDPIVVTARQSEFDAAEELGAAGEVVEVEAGEIDALGAEFVRLEGGEGGDRPDLNDAEVVVSGGRGMGGAENFKKLEDLADLFGAALGASRAVTDAGWVPADWQVGQTGKIVSPNLYFCIAISGAIQHLAGMKNSKCIVAVNKDPEAPIFQVADYGLVAKWEEALPELVEEIKKAKTAG